MHLTNIELHRKYGIQIWFRHYSAGPVVRIAPNEVILDDPQAVKTIYGHATEFIKAPWYYASGGIHPEIGNDLLTDRDKKRHAKNR